MTRIKKLTVVATSAVLALSLASCAGDIENMKQGYSVYMQSSEHLAPTQPSDIKLVYKDDPSAEPICTNYNTLGQIRVQTNNAVGFNKSLIDINNDLKKGAAAQGGDAVINLDKNMFEYAGYIIKCPAK